MAEVDSGAKHNAVFDLLGAPVPGTSKALIRVGTGAPTADPPDAFLYIRTDGASATTLYVGLAAAWEVFTSA